MQEVKEPFSCGWFLYPFRDIKSESVDGILEYCPYLKYLYFVEKAEDKEDREALENYIKKGLKRLKVFEVEADIIQFGTEWLGYSDLE